MNVRHDNEATGAQLRRLLRHWRDLRGKSQLELALDMGISQRHLSFVESGRSTPSRQMLVELAQALDIPLRERNRLLLAAGFAPMYAEDDFDPEAVDAINRALHRVLRQHEPFPAMVLDRYWNVLLANQAAPKFLNTFIDLDARPRPRNILHLMFDPAGMRPFIANWDDASRALVERVRREAVGHMLDDRSLELLSQLSAYPDVAMDTSPDLATPPSPAPVIPLSFLKDGRRLNYFSMVTTVGTPLTASAQEIRIECMFPMDDATEAAHRALMALVGQS